MCFYKHVILFKITVSHILVCGSKSVSVVKNKRIICPVERLCPEVNDSVQASLVTGHGPFLPDTVLTYECNEGYELAVGHLELLCQKDGLWSGKAAKCTGTLDMS